MDMMAESTIILTKQVSFSTSQTLTCPARHPDATQFVSRGWYLTVHGVRGWPTKVWITLNVSASIILMVWSPWDEANAVPVAL